MSDTPDTDAETIDGIDYYGDPLKSWDYKPSKDCEVVPAEFARRLERERDGAIKERDEARRELEEARYALEWIVGQYGHEKTTAQLAIEAYEMFYMARWTLQGMKQKEEA